MLLEVVAVSNSVGKLKPRVPQRFGVPEADPFGCVGSAGWGSGGASSCGAALGQSG